jgi:DNA (cytosine-5)-methyltransferase 1
LARTKSRTSRKASGRLKAISLFTGVGGLDFGFEAAGFHTAVAVEVDEVACRTIRLNRKWPVIHAPIEDVSSEQLLRAGGLKAGEADVLIGGPPCQPFSKSGYWHRGDSRRLEDPRANTLAQYLRVLEDTKPRVFLLENVPGLAFDSKNEGLQFLLKGIAEVNRRAGTKYDVRWQVLNAADFGVPQIRQRVFLVASRDGAKFEFPRVRFREAGAADISLPTYRTAWDAIGDLQSESDETGLEVGGKWGDLLPTIPEGHNYLWHTSRGGGKQLFGWRTRYWCFLLKLAKDRPSWTIQAQPGTAIGPFHWKNRRLTSRELCRLQTFPDGLRFDCGRLDIQRLLGNAVPSLLAEILAWDIRKQFLGYTRKIPNPKLLPPIRIPVQDAEVVRPVPLKYKPLIGNHAAHPGTGKGRGAQARATGQAVLFELNKEPEAA